MSVEYSPLLLDIIRDSRPCALVRGRFIFFLLTNVYRYGILKMSLENRRLPFVFVFLTANAPYSAIFALYGAFVFVGII